MLMTTQAGGIMSGGRASVSYTQTTNITTGGNIYTLMGSPAGAADYTFIINSGVTISSNSTGTPALTTGSFPSGSTLTIVNNGNIRGMGGAGGAGAGQPSLTPVAGSAGGNAMNISLNVTIDNTSGNIWGGGGGGGGGGLSAAGGCAPEYVGGGGGGGGASGSTNSSAGVGGSSSAGYGGNNGSAGTSAGAGSGGTGGDRFGTTGGTGGTGGTWGSSGSTGGTGVPNGGSSDPGAAGGAGGKAVNLNGFSVTWIAGNNGTQVRGAVS